MPKSLREYDVLYADSYHLRHINNRVQFIEKVISISKDLLVNPDWLMLIFMKESGINPEAQNPITRSVGLIQFMPNTAKSLGTNVYELKQMSGVRQLDYVRAFYSQFDTNDFRSFTDLYLAAFFPAALGQDNDFVIQTRNISAQTIYDQNPAIARYSDERGIITVGDFKKYTKAAIKEANLNYYRAMKYDIFLIWAKNKKLSLGFGVIMLMAGVGTFLYQRNYF